MTPRLIAWATSKAGFNRWHLSPMGKWEPFCQQVVPDQARLCESTSVERAVSLHLVCRKCLKVYSEQEVA